MKIVKSCGFREENCCSAICYHIIEGICRFLYRGLCFLGYFSSFLYLIYDSDGKKPRNAAVALANLMDYSIATLDSEIIFLLIGKAIQIRTYVVSTANNNVRSAAMDICSSVTRCFTLLKLDTHSKVLKLLRRGVTRENYRFVRFTSFTSTPLFSPSIFCSYITAIT